MCRKQTKFVWGVLETARPLAVFRFLSLMCFEPIWTCTSLFMERQRKMAWISIRNTQLVFLHIYFDMYTAPPNPFWFCFCFVDLSSCLPNCLDIRSWTVSGTASVRNCRCEQTTLSFVCQWELVMVSRLITLSFLHNEWITWPTHQSVSQPDDLGWWPIRKQWRIFHIICVQFLDALNLCCLGSMWIYAFLLRFLLFFKRGRAGLVIKFSINSSIL